jgi:hypothetical protein
MEVMKMVVAGDGGGDDDDDVDDDEQRKSFLRHPSPQLLYLPTTPPPPFALKIHIEEFAHAHLSSVSIKHLKLSHPLTHFSKHILKTFF